MKMKGKNILAHYLTLRGVRYKESFISFILLLMKSFSIKIFYFPLRYITFARLFKPGLPANTTGSFKLHWPQCFIRAVLSALPAGCRKIASGRGKRLYRPCNRRNKILKRVTFLCEKRNNPGLRLPIRLIATNRKNENRLAERCRHDVAKNIITDHLLY